MATRALRPRSDGIKGEMPDYEIGKIVFGDAASIDAAYRLFRDQPIDESRLAAVDAPPPFPVWRQTLASEAQIA